MISSGGLFVEPFDVSFVPGACVPLPLVGSAMGGSVGVEIGEVIVSVPTLAGQPLAAILKALALAIRNHPVLESLGISATVSGLVLQVRGDGPAVSAFSDDPGLLLGSNGPPGVPALPPAGLGALAALLAAAGVLAPSWIATDQAYPNRSAASASSAVSAGVARGRSKAGPPAGSGALARRARMPAGSRSSKTHSEAPRCAGMRCRSRATSSARSRGSRS